MLSQAMTDIRNWLNVLRNGFIKASVGWRAGRIDRNCNNTKKGSHVNV